MKTVEEVMNQIWGYVDSVEYRVLKEWAESIIDKCAEELAHDDMDSEVVNELKQQL